VKGIVTGAEVADLNVDGSTGADAKASVVAYVANRRKSLSMAFMAPLSDTSGAADGYWGQDGFAVLEGVLGRRFPIHDESRAPPGRMRQLQYVLDAREAVWILKVDRILEF
jgi:hypothetical protein